MTTHKKMPGRLHSAAGDGYFESYDYGQTWKRSVVGLGDYDYLFSLAVDSGDPKFVIVLNGPLKHILLKIRNHSFIEELRLLMILMIILNVVVMGSGRLYQMGFLNLKEHSFQFLQQIQ
jgi:hypothetical protein